MAMTGIDYVIEAELMGPLAPYWLAALSSAMRQSLARWAVDQLDFDAGRVRDSWIGLDDPVTRSVAIASDPLLGAAVGEILVPDKRGGQHVQLEEAIKRSGMSGRQSKPKLCSRIAALVPRWLPRPELMRQASNNPFAEGWTFVANEIGKRTHEQYAAWRAAGAAQEWRLINHLLLEEYFRQCRHQEARQVMFELEDARAGAMSLRGTLVNTSRWVSQSAVAESVVPISGFYGGANLHHRDRSDLVACVHRESGATAAGTGVIQRIAGHHTQDVPEAQGLRTTFLRDFRDLSQHTQQVLVFPPCQ